MKNQALTTTLALLLAMALSAIVALVVSSEVIGTNHVVADAPAPVVVDTAAPAPAAQVDPQQPQDSQEPAPVEPAAPAAEVTADPEAPIDPEEPAPAEPEAPIDPETPTPADPEAPIDPEEPAPAEPEAPVDPEEPAPADPCDGVIIEDECVPGSCPLGYELLDGDCLYIGCPLGFILENGVCEKLQITLPCPDGLVRQDDGSCKPEFIFDPAVVLPLLCVEGLQMVDGECVPICPKGMKWVNGFCLPDGIGPVSPELDFNAFTD